MKMHDKGTTGIESKLVGCDNVMRWKNICARQVYLIQE